MGRWQEALDYFLRGFERNPRDAENAWASVALTAGMMHRFDESARYSELSIHFDSARVLLESHVRELPPDAVWAYQGSLHLVLGIAYAALGRSADAVRYGELVLESLLRVGDALTAPTRRADLAEIYLLNGDADEALDQLEQIMARQARSRRRRCASTRCGDRCTQTRGSSV